MLNGGMFNLTIFGNWVHQIIHYTCISVDGYVGFSHYYFYFKMLPIDVQWHFNISFFFGINIIISGSNNIVKERLLSQVTFYIVVISLSVAEIVSWNMLQMWEVNEFQNVCGVVLDNYRIC